jgi:hypothetical protein
MPFAISTDVSSGKASKAARCAFVSPAAIFAMSVMVLAFH